MCSVLVISALKVRAATVSVGFILCVVNNRLEHYTWSESAKMTQVIIGSVSSACLRQTVLFRVGMHSSVWPPLIRRKSTVTDFKGVRIPFLTTVTNASLHEKRADIVFIVYTKP